MQTEAGSINTQPSQLRHCSQPTNAVLGGGVVQLQKRIVFKKSPVKAFGVVKKQLQVLLKREF